MKRFLYIVLLVSLTISFSLVFTNCRKANPPKAVITVVDVDLKPVEQAMVIVKAATSDSSHTMVYLLKENKPVADTQYTNSEGKVTYDFKYPSIYKVEVTKDKDRKNPFIRRGLDVLILENDKVIEKKIEINEQTVFN